MNTKNQASGQHWEDFYSAGTIPTLPSQFAVFALNEFPQAASVLELGCGNGRDSLFFARQGLRVMGSDRSQAAIGLCQSKAGVQKVNARFEECNLNDAVSVARLRKVAEEYLTGDTLVYARFVIHAIDLQAEARLLEIATEVLGTGNSAMVVEFRTQRDQQQVKVTPDHFRRFVDPIAFAQRCMTYDLKCDYFVEGFGLAKYKADDAHVARLILSRRA